MSDSSASPNLLDKDDNDNSPVSSSAKDKNSTDVDASGDDNSSWRKHSDTSSSPNLVVKGKTDDEVNALGDNDSSDNTREKPKKRLPQKPKSSKKQSQFVSLTRRL